MANILQHTDGAIATITVSNPSKHNAITPEMWQALGEAFSAAERDPSVQVIELTGEGEQAFVSGADIGRFGERAATERAATERAATLSAPSNAPYLLPLACSKPTVATIRGFCMGGGLGLAAACDIRLCADNAVFRMPAARLGIGYSFEGLGRVIDLIGPANASDIFLSARRFNAAEALRLGFVQQVLPLAEFAAASRAYLTQMAENAPLSLLAMKRSTRAWLQPAAERDMAAVKAAIAACMQSDDHREGKAAFMEKRTPNFQGR
jgi:enoyl-CoA hydratase/carnithine racemase